MNDDDEKYINEMKDMVMASLRETLPQAEGIVPRDRFEMAMDMLTANGYDRQVLGMAFEAAKSAEEPEVRVGLLTQLMNMLRYFEGQGAVTSTVNNEAEDRAVE